MGKPLYKMPQTGHDRSALGAADVTDAELQAMVAAQLAPMDPVDSVSVLSSQAHIVPYDLPALTTVGRYWVRGAAETQSGTRSYSFFVKHIQSWSRSPLFAFVPAELQDFAEQSVPWRTEALVYRSDLGARLPSGLSMARAFGVYDLDEKSAALWLAEVPATARVWTDDDVHAAARLLGRVAASPAVAPLADVGEHPWAVSDYLAGRLQTQVLPMLGDEAIWMHPLVAPAFDHGLRSRLLAVAGVLEDLVTELDGMPRLTAHGDACPNNLLLLPGGDGFALVDFGFWGRRSVGYDLAQLLVGEVQLGRQPASELARLEPSVLTAYVQGLREEGCDLPVEVVRRAHALQLLIFTGLSCLPFEHLSSPVTAPLRKIAAERAAIAQFSLDLHDSTST